MPLPLTALLPRLQRLLRDLRQRLGRRELLPATWIGALVALEVLGRWSSTDVADAPAVLVLLALVAFTWREHTHEPQRFVQRVLRPLRALRGAIERHGFQAGSDLRREPLLPRRLPPILFASSLVALGFATVLVLVRHNFPTDARAVLTSVSGALYYLLLAVLWCALGAGSLSVLAPPILLQDRLERGEKRPTGKRIALVSPLFAVYFVLLGTLSIALDRWVPLAVSGAAVLLSACVRLAPGGPHLDMVWRPSEERRGARTGVVDLAWLASWRDLILWCVIACLALLSGGDRMSGAPSLATESTVFTAGISALFTWSASSFLAGWALFETYENLLARLRNPERRRRPVVRLVGVEEDDRLRASLESGGFRVLFGEGRPRSRTDVPIALRSPSSSASPAAFEETEFSLSEHWPLAVSAAELETDAVRWKLARRHELLCRRHLLRGLRRAFRAVPRRELERAAGLWVDPHQASSLSLIVELEDDEGRTHVGPPYHKVLPLAARSHLYQVWRALQIDLVFVEVGVSFKQLRRVFGIAFEVYDMHAGKQCALERHFLGLPGLRVVIDEVSSDSSLELTGYPEPDYEDIGRARVLHVFRDRGGDRARVTDPDGAGDVPSPELLLA